jgi:site-specific recombinase XerD
MLRYIARTNVYTNEEPVTIMGRAPAKKTRRAYREGSVSQRKNGLWVGRIEAGVDAEGERRQITVTSMDHAKMLEKMTKARAEFKTYGYVTSASLTVTEWTEKWLTQIASGRVRGKTYAGYASLLRKWVQPKIGRRKLAAVTTDDIRAIHADMRKAGRAQSFIRQAHAVISKCFEDAVREGNLTINVCGRMDRPAPGTNTRGAFTIHQVRQLLDAAEMRGDSRHMAALLMGTRQSEALGLTWTHVDLTAGFARIDWQLQELREKHGCGGRGSDGVYPCSYKQAARCPERSWQVPDDHIFHIVEGRMALVKPKSIHGARQVPLVPRMLAALQRQRDAVEPGPYDLIWHDNGHPIPHKADEAEWKDLVTSVGLPAECTLHWARHTAATQLMESGVDAKVVGEIVGHGSVAVTRGYQHVSSEMARAGMSKLGELLA